MVFSDQTLAAKIERRLASFRAAWEDKDGNDDHGRSSKSDPTGNDKFGKTPSEKTTTALAASNKANASMKPEDHIAAMTAHNVAGTSHYFAAKAGDKSSKGKAALHTKIAQFHEKVAHEIRQQAQWGGRHIYGDKKKP